MRKKVFDGHNSKIAYSLRLMKKILSLAHQYGWETNGYDELQSELASCLHVGEAIERLAGDECYASFDYILRLGNTSSLVKALEEAMDDIPGEAIHIDGFNPDIDSHKIDFLCEKNLFYNVIHSSWGDNKATLQNFIEDLRSADKSPSRPTTASRLHPALCD